MDVAILRVLENNMKKEESQKGKNRETLQPPFDSLVLQHMVAPFVVLFRFQFLEAIFFLNHQMQFSP